MKYLPLIWAGLWRKPLRTTLTGLSIVAAFVVLGLLQSVAAGFAGMTSAQRADRIHVNPKYGEWMPFSYLHQIESIPGILAIAYDIPWGGYFREPKEGFGLFWTDPQNFFIVYPELHVAPEYVEAMKKNRMGIIVDAKRAQKYGWKIGDKVMIGSSGNRRTDGTELWPFEVVGTYTRAPSLPEFWMCCVAENYPYFDEAGATDKGKVGQFMIRVRDARQSTQIAAAIDKLFENSAAETQTDTERDNNFQRGTPIGLITRMAMIAGFSIILIVTTVTTLQSLRERTPEFGVLKALGFGNSHIQALIGAECAALTLTAAMIGFCGAMLFMRFAMQPPFGGELRLAALYWGVVAALAVAIAGSAIPIWRVTRLDAAKILAGIGV